MAQILTANELNKIAQGSGYKGGSFSSVGLPTTLNSTNTTPTPPINLTPKPDNTNYAGMINSAAQQSLTYTTPSGAEVDTQGNLVSEPKPTPQSSNSILDYIKSYTSIQPPSATQTYNEGLANDQQLAQTKADLNAKKAITAEAQGRLNNISAQLQALNTEAQYVPVQVQQDSQGRGITAGGAAPLQADKLRAIALRALPLQAQGALIQAEVATAQGQEKLAQDLYTQAQDHFDKMFTLQMQDAQNQYEFKTNLINKVYEFADKQEQNQLQLIRDQANRDFQDQQRIATQDFQTNRDKINNQQAIALKRMELGVKPPEVKTINGVDMEWNPTTKTWQPINAGASSVAQTQKSLDQFSFIRETIKDANKLASAAGPSLITQAIGNTFVGNTKVKQLATKLDSLKVNLLTLNTDPSIKKFFGPQMTERDTQLMTAAGTTMDAYSNTEADLKKELQRYDDLINRMETAVKNGLKTQGNFVTSPKGEIIELTN